MQFSTLTALVLSILAPAVAAWPTEVSFEERWLNLRVLMRM
jgi:hypothetical protein